MNVEPFLWHFFGEILKNIAKVAQHKKEKSNQQVQPRNFVSQDDEWA